METESTQSKQKSFLKRLREISFWFFVVLLLLLSSGVTVGYIYQDEVKQYVVGELNKRLKTKIEVKDIHFSVIKKFPFATLQFENIKIYEALKVPSNKLLLSAENVYLQFNLIDIFNKNYKIKNLEIDNGEVNIKQFADKSDNFHFWKEVSDTVSQQGNVAIALKKIILSNIRFTYFNEVSNIQIESNVKHLQAKGLFSESSYTLDAQSDLFVNQLRIDKTDYVKQKAISSQVSLEVTNNELFEFKQGEVKIEKLVLDITGSFRDKKTNSSIDLTIKGKGMEAVSVVSLLPKKYLKQLEGIESKGKLFLTIQLKGNVGDSGSPQVLADFGMKDASISLKKSAVDMTSVNFKGNYTNGKAHSLQTSFLRLSDVSFIIQKGEIKGNFLINNFQQPYAVGNAEGHVNLADLQEFLKIDTIENLSGDARINLQFEGELKDVKQYTASDWRQSKTSGTLNLSNVSVKLKGKPNTISEMNASLRFDNTDIDISNLAAKVASSDFSFVGTFKNIIPFMISSQEKMGVVANLRSNTIDLDELLMDDKNVSKGDTAYRLRLPDNIDFNLKADIGKLLFRRFSATEITGNIMLRERKLAFEPLSFNTMDGAISIVGIADATDLEKIKVICEATTSKVNINRMLYQLENFGQEYITDKNIRGLLTANIQFSSIWNSKLQPNNDKLYAKCDVMIEKGELIDFEPTLALSKYIDVNELKHISFKTLKNQVEIKNRTIYIPQMEINSSALNISFNGTHTFDNYLDYHFKILLNELLGKKARASKKENNEFGEVQDDGLGKLALHISMVGPATNPKISYDKIGLKKKLKEDVKIEQQNVKSLLKDEFGWFKNDSLTKQNAKKAPAIQMEWEEDDKQKTKNEKLKEEKKSQEKRENKLLNKIAKPNKEEKSKENSDDYQ